MIDFKNVETVVVPIDLSQDSWEAVGTALTITAPEHIRLVHAMAPLSAVVPGVVFATVDDAGRSAAIRAKAMEGMAERGLPELSLSIRSGSPGLEVCEYSAEIGAHLIVVASHGRTAIRRLLLGSVAEVILRHAPCPVLVIRRPAKA